MFKVKSFMGNRDNLRDAMNEANEGAQAFIDAVEKEYPMQVIGVSVTASNLVTEPFGWAQVLTVVVEIVDELEAGHANEYVVNLLKEGAV